MKRVSSSLRSLVFDWVFLALLLSGHQFSLIAPVLSSSELSPDYLLSLGDDALSQGNNEKAIERYKSGLDLLANVDDPPEKNLIVLLSLETNLGSALSAVGLDEESAEHYKNAIKSYHENVGKISDNDNDIAKEIAVTASFYLGMVYQDMGEPNNAVEFYSWAVSVDNNHWMALANLASVLHDLLNRHDEALEGYNKAYQILTEGDPTDPPDDAKPILSQLQYRIGLCLNHDPNRKCAVTDDPETPVSCKEMATHAFSLAVQFDPDNVSAKHMLSTITADATMTRASNDYVKSLFDEYARNFEHSLVQELGYNGFERLRRGFDRSFGGRENVPTFPLVVDAGCGTGLVGEQFRNISTYLVGVDLSEAILDEAEKLRPKLYDERIAGDVTEVFRQKKPISLIIAADSYIYFGDLVPLFESMQDSVAEDGYIAFTLENVDEESELALKESKPDWRWQLTASGRFAHRDEYVVKVGKDHGFDLVFLDKMDGFRSEHGRVVRGHLFVMKKLPSKTAKDEL